MKDGEEQRWLSLYGKDPTCENFPKTSWNEVSILESDGESCKHPASPASLLHSHVLSLCYQGGSKLFQFITSFYRTLDWSNHLHKM